MALIPRTGWSDEDPDANDYDAWTSIAAHASAPVILPVASLSRLRDPTW
jgi:hypothetical protein